MKGLQFLTEVPEGEQVVSMVNHRDRIFVATQKRVYELVDDELRAVEVKPIPRGGELS